MNQLSYDYTQHAAIRLCFYEQSGEKKLSYGEWLQMHHLAWKTKNKHNGFFDSPERMQSFDSFLDKVVNGKTTNARKIARNR